MESNRAATRGQALNAIQAPMGSLGMSKPVDGRLPDAGGSIGAGRTAFSRLVGVCISDSERLTSYRLSLSDPFHEGES